MNKPLVRVRPPVSEEVFRDLRDCSRHKDRALDEQELRRLVQRAVDRSWLLCKAIEKDTFSRLQHAWEKQRAAESTTATAQGDLQTALNNPRGRHEEQAEQFAKARRRLQLMEARYEKAVNQTLRDFKEIEFMEPGRLTAALSPLDREVMMSAWTVPKKGRGRKLGKRDHLECRHFVHEFLTAVYRAGGELKFNKNYDGGPLLDALERLKPYLPRPVTEGLSRSLLADVRHHWPKQHTIDLEIPFFINVFLTEMIRDGKFVILQAKES